MLLLTFASLYQAYGGNASRVTNYQLLAYQAPNDTDVTLHHALTIWQGYVPTDRIGDLQAAVRNSTSPLFMKQPSAQDRWIASYLEPNFDILTNAGRPKTQQTNAVDSGNNHSTVVRDALIGVLVGLAGVIILLLAFIFYRRRRAQKERDAIRRPASIRSNRSALRETWSPTAAERQRVMAGELAETWSHHGGRIDREGSISPNTDPFGDEQQPVNSTLAGAGAAMVGGGAVAAVGTRTSHHTERSHHTTNTHNTHNTSGTGQSDNSLTPSQRIRLDYEEQQGRAITTDGNAATQAPEMSQRNYI